MSDKLEPKQTVDETIDKFFESQDGGDVQPQETAQPETEQPEGQPEAGGEPAKQTPTDDNKVKDKGFASHPAWVEREQKIKEADARIKELERSSSIYAKLLDEPSVYKKYLEAQGFRPEEIERAMAAKGFQEKPIAADTQAKMDLMEETCKELGWNIKALTDEQIAYLKDHVKLTEKIFEKLIGSRLDQRLAPLEKNEAQRALERDTERGYDASRKMAEEEFPTLDWDKDILPTIGKYLDDLDVRDPKGTIKMTPEEVYEKATRQLLKEKKFAEVRQEERNDLKKNARGLTPRPSTRPQPNSFKGKTVRETADNFLDSLGVKE